MRKNVRKFSKDLRSVHLVNRLLTIVMFIFCEIRFLIRSPTNNPLTFSRTCQVVIFAPSNRLDTFFKNLSPKSPHYEKTRAKIPVINIDVTQFTLTSTQKPLLQ